MATINVSDFDGLEVAIEKPLAPGRVGAASSRPVALSTEDKTALDAVATQATSLAILAKLHAAPATEAKQDSAITQETAINTVLGTKADAKASTSDATPISAVSIWKQISFSIQAVASAVAGTLTVATHAVTGSGNFATTVADGSDVASGAKADTAWVSGAGSVIAILKGIFGKLPAALGAGGGLKIDGSGTALPISGTVSITGGGDASATNQTSQITQETAINTVLGTKTDAKSVATDATSTSAVSIWKQISASVQAIASSIAGTLTVATHAVTGSGNFASTVADGANVTIGAKADARTTTTDTTAVSSMSVLKQISFNGQIESGHLNNVVGAAGTQADSVYTGGTGTMIAILKGIYTQIVALFPASLGRKAAANSLAVVLSTEDFAALGGGGGGGGAVTVANGADVSQGAVADAAWTSGNGSVIAILKKIANGAAATLSSIYNSTPPTYTDGQTTVLQTDSHASLKVIQTAADGSIIVPLAAGSAAMASAMPTTIATDDTMTKKVIAASATATLTNLASSTTSAQVLASTAGRFGVALFNDDANAVYIKYGTTASATSYTVKIPTDSYWEMPSTMLYTGRIDAVWVADGAGSLRITELTA